MPVIKCNNGKYRIGSGSCIYDTKEKADEVWRAILAQGKYASDENKVSFDYDGVLSTDAGKEKAKQLIDEGKTIYIISARREKSSMLTTAKNLGIPESRVYATGSNKSKVQKIVDLGIGEHYDNNPDVISELKKTETKGHIV
jgi:hypothetical protein